MTTPAAMRRAIREWKARNPGKGWGRQRKFTPAQLAAAIAEVHGGWRHDAGLVGGIAGTATCWQPIPVADVAAKYGMSKSTLYAALKLAARKRR